MIIFAEKLQICHEKIRKLKTNYVKIKYNLKKSNIK